MTHPFKLCPACEGEGKVETGYDYCDRETGAWSPVLAECTMCEGKGGVPDDGQDEPGAETATFTLSGLDAEAFVRQVAAGKRTPEAEKMLARGRELLKQMGAAPSPTAILPASILLAAGLSYEGTDKHGTIHMSLAAPVKRVQS